jgi:hypothetical protein
MGALNATVEPVSVNGRMTFVFNMAAVIVWLIWTAVTGNRTDVFG